LGRRIREDSSYSRLQLLPQPGGFEGLSRVPVEAKGDRSPSPQLPDPGDMPVDFRATLTTLALAMEQCHHYVVHDPRVFHSPAVALPGRINIGEEPPDALALGRYQG
jgi:hypothetical protein